MKEVHQGSYICASVVYELLALPKVVSHYHCSQCRKGTGQRSPRTAPSRVVRSKLFAAPALKLMLLARQ